MSNDEAYVYFRITGIDQEIEELTALMDIAPIEAKRRGEPGKYRASLLDGQWELHSPLPRTEMDLGAHMEALLQPLEEKASAIRKLHERYGLWLVLVGYYATRDLGFFFQRLR